MSVDGEGGRGCPHKEQEGVELTVGDEGGARGERGRATATVLPKPIADLFRQWY